MTTGQEQSRQRELQALLQRGFEALSRGQVAQAGDCCRQVLQMQPDLVEGHFLVGLVALEAQDRKTAFSAFGSVTKLEPRHAAAWAQLARLFVGDGQLGRADAALDKATSGELDDPLVCDLVGTVYSRMGDHDLASAWYEQANRGRPDFPPYMLNLANNYTYHGRTDEAVAILGRVLEFEGGMAQAHWALAGAKKAKDATHIDAMRKLLNGQRYHPRAQAFLYYAIGKELSLIHISEPTRRH